MAGGACPLFDPSGFVRCGAVAGEACPTLHERERFCCGDGHEHCPTLRAMLRRGRPLSEAEYFAVWMPPVTRLDDEITTRIPRDLPLTD